jgi:L-2-hydroxyglutarate oxidase LhgO
VPRFCSFRKRASSRAIKPDTDTTAGSSTPESNKPGSPKAKLCREGAASTKSFCSEHGIPFKTVGKLVVATSDVELERLIGLEQNARQNDIESAG